MGEKREAPRRTWQCSARLREVDVLCVLIYRCDEKKKKQNDNGVQVLQLAVLHIGVSPVLRKITNLRLQFAMLLLCG